MPTPDLDTLRALRDKVAGAAKSDRRLDYTLFTTFAPRNQGSFCDPKEGNDFTSSPSLRRCAILALGALIAEQEAAHVE